MVIYFPLYLGMDIQQLYEDAHLGLKIQMVMLAKGITQRKLAAKLGRNKSRVNISLKSGKVSKELLEEVEEELNFKFNGEQ